MRRWMTGIALVGVLFLLVRFFTRTLSVAPGELVAYTLPDGSQMLLNVNARATYKPLWWWVSPEVDLEGEAYFEVATTDSLTVWLGRERVIAQDARFFVNSTGTPYGVWSDAGAVVVQGRGEARVVTEGEFLGTEQEGLAVLPWANGVAPTWHRSRFIYLMTPMEGVIRDMERVYGVRVVLDGVDVTELTYTGLFDKAVSVEEAIEIICYSFGWRYERLAAAHYVIRNGTN